MIIFLNKKNYIAISNFYQNEFFIYKIIQKL